MIELKEDNLGEVLSKTDIVLVQYGAGWCGNCRIMKPKFKKFAAENPETSFYYVDAEKFPNSRQHADVSNLPTFAAFKKGAIISQVQTNKLQVLKDFVDEVASN
tara:strand:- start:2525 stop:2836 length:312 start_codon:yes stop_codon:yes gene_type:complete